MNISELITYIKTTKKCVTSFFKLFVNMGIWCIIVLRNLHKYNNRSKHLVYPGENYLLTSYSTRLIVKV